MDLQLSNVSRLLLEPECNVRYYVQGADDKLGQFLDQDI
jgi:hypothetical protein